MTLVLSNAPIPLQDPIARARRAGFGDKPDPQEGVITDPWADWLTRLAGTVNIAPSRLGSVAVGGQTASISATDFSGGSLNAGLYRVSYYAQITQAAGVSSSLTITLTWTAVGVSQSEAFAAITGNTTSTHSAAPNDFFFYADGSPVKYATTYASVGAPVMSYLLYLSLESVQV